MCHELNHISESPMYASHDGVRWGDVTTPNIFNRFGFNWLLIGLLVVMSGYHGSLITECNGQLFSDTGIGS
jgi:hypothetical protein